MFLFVVLIVFMGCLNKAHLEQKEFKKIKKHNRELVRKCKDES